MKNVLFLRIGPVAIAPYWLAVYGGRSWPSVLLSALLALSTSFLKKFQARPWRSLAPVLSVTLTMPPPVLPYWAS